MSSTTKEKMMSHKIVFGFFDEEAQKEIRRALLKAVALPGYIVPFASREMPIARGWGTGGLQVTLSLIRKEDILKVIDQGCDGSVNAVNIRNFIVSVTGVRQTVNTNDATVIQTRHRIPEEGLGEEQILVFQVPYPEVLTTVEPDTDKQKEMHANLDYSKLWVLLYEDTSQFGDSRISNRYPVVINGHYAMDPSPIPRFDIPKLSDNPALLLFGAGREKRVYAIPPYTEVRPLIFDDRPFRIEDFGEHRCERCGSQGVFFDMVKGKDRDRYYCSDTDFCDRTIAQHAGEE